MIENPERISDGELRDIMLYLEGSTTAFRCNCKCNVFKHPSNKPEDANKYICNGCRTEYIAEFIDELEEQP